MSKCWYCNNELTTGDSPKHFGICNKCYDEMFKSSDTIIRSLTNKISDLEAKLAEKDAERELDNSFWKQECDSLQKQLAEKEKEIDNLYDRLNSKQKFYEMSLEKDYKEYLSRLDKLEKQCDKDKISFAVEQLTQAIKNIKKCNYKDFGIMYQSDAIAVIDNQINVLRNNKDGIH